MPPTPLALVVPLQAAGPAHEPGNQVHPEHGGSLQAPVVVGCNLELCLGWGHL